MDFYTDTYRLTKFYLDANSYLFDVKDIDFEDVFCLTINYINNRKRKKILSNIIFVHDRNDYWQNYCYYNRFSDNYNCNSDFDPLFNQIIVGIDFDYLNVARFFKVTDFDYDKTKYIIFPFDCKLLGTRTDIRNTLLTQTIQLKRNKLTIPFVLAIGEINSYRYVIRIMNPLTNKHVWFADKNIRKQFTEAKQELYNYMMKSKYSEGFDECYLVLDSIVV